MAVVQGVITKIKGRPDGEFFPPQVAITVTYDIIDGETGLLATVGMNADENLLDILNGDGLVNGGDDVEFA